MWSDIKKIVVAIIALLIGLFGFKKKAKANSDRILLSPQEYDMAYFEGIEVQKQGLKPHPAGYGQYGAKINWIEWEKIIRKEAGIVKKTLELGCGYGHLVKRFRDTGIESYGIDVSKYALSRADESISKYLSCGDIRTDLANYSNGEFDLIFGLNILSCFTDQELTSLLAEAHRIGKKVIFVVFEENNNNFYNIKSVNDWTNIISKETTLISLHTKAITKV